ncbi:MAG: SAM-dependent methyltransferase [Promethearchaeota archaeon]
MLDLWLLSRITVLIFCICVVLYGAWVVWPLVIGAAWIPTPTETGRKILELAKVREDDVLVDLGSGDGRIIIMAAEDYGATAIGIEADPLRVLWSRRAIRRRSLENKVHVIQGNFFNQDLSSATVVFVYQCEGVNRRLKDKLASELKPGTRIVSFSHPFDGWTPVETTEKPDIYLYVV